MEASPSTSPPSLVPPMKAKLTGRAFYESLGSPQMILAPMVDQSEFAWRLLTRSFMNADSSKPLLAYTPMLHARMFKETGRFRDKHFQPTRAGLASMPVSTATQTSSAHYLDGHPALDRPLIVQFCANDPNELLEAAKYVQPFCDAVDLNLGCPQGIARKGNYGAFLQEDWDKIYKLVNTLHANLDVPITAKIRILETKEKTLEYAQTIISAGASILTVHGRQRDQKGHKTGLADWSVIRYLRENLPPDTVLFANGNILRYEDIARCLKATGADGVMSAEGNLHDPTIFAPPPVPRHHDREYWQGRNGKGGYRMDAVFRRYMDIIHKYVLETEIPSRKPVFLPTDPVTAAFTGEAEPHGAAEEPSAKRRKRNNQQGKSTSPNLCSMQAHLFSLLRPLVSVQTHVRDALAHCRTGDIAAFERVLGLVEDAVRKGLQDYEAFPEKYEESPVEEVANGTAPLVTTTVDDWEVGKIDSESSLATVRACKRPWWVCQPYVRPLPKEALAKGSLTLSKKERQKQKLEDAQVIDTKYMDHPEGASVTEEGNRNAAMNKAVIPNEAMACG